ncbi:MAG: DUF2490 domain-containing protein, partial [Bacteroidia bacterium]|nr:DUF2490 domain-containing protein [Bacteroidia bacterium]
MTMFYTRILFLFLVFISFLGISQNNIDVYSLPKVSLNHKVSSTYKVNFFATARQQLYDSSNLTFNQNQIEIGHFSTLKITPKFDLSFGLRYTNESWFEDRKANELRLTEQLNFKSSKSYVRFGHRLRLEQRI